MRPIGFGIIGIGRQGLRLAEHIRNDIDHAELAAVCRRSDSGHEYSKQHGLKFYSNHHDLLNDNDIDAVIITTPSSLHGSQAMDALRAGKHVLIDKPIASTNEDAEMIRSFALKEGLLVGINFPLRVNPVTKALKENLPNIGRLKKIQMIASHGPPRSKWQQDISLSSGGVILDLGSHYFDLISFVTGSRPGRVTSAFSEEKENEHSGFIELEHAHFNVSLTLLRNQKLKKNLIVCAGEKGLIYADYSMREVIVSNDHRVEEIKCGATQDFRTILDNMVGAIHKKEELIADAEAGVASLRTVLSAYKSVRTAAPATI